MAFAVLVTWCDPSCVGFRMVCRLYFFFLLVWLACTLAFRCAEKLQRTVYPAESSDYGIHFLHKLERDVQCTLVRCRLKRLTISCPRSFFFHSFLEGGYLFLIVRKSWVEVCLGTCAYIVTISTIQISFGVKMLFCNFDSEQNRNQQLLLTNVGYPDLRDVLFAFMLAYFVALILPDVLCILV